MIYKLFILFVVGFNCYIFGKVNGYNEGYADMQVDGMWKEHIKEGKNNG